MGLEGTEVCEWLNSIGVTGVLLKNRVSRRPNLSAHGPPLQDAQRALGLVRRRAGERGLDPHRIGVLGFSAGGHLSAALSNNHDARTYSAIDDADRVSCRPDFCVLIYPGSPTAKTDPTASLRNWRSAPRTLRRPSSPWPGTIRCAWKTPCSTTSP